MLGLVKRKDFENRIWRLELEFNRVEQQLTALCEYLKIEVEYEPGKWAATHTEKKKK